MTTVYPPSWNHDYDLADGVREVLASADCGLLQATVQLGFVLAVLLLGEDDTGTRVALAEAIAEKLLEVARTGRLPDGGMLQ